MRANILTTTVFRALLVLAIVVLASNMVFALSEQELRDKSAELNKDINSGKKKLGHAHKEVNTLQEKVDQLAGEISDIQSDIDKTNNNIDKTAKELKKTEKELERQEEIMNESLRSLYKHGSVSTIELLASSKSFTQFINGQEYLSRVKIAVQESAAKIAELRDELKQKRADLDELLELHKGQRKIVASKKSEQDVLLGKAKDKQFSYKKYVNSKQKQQANVEASLENFLISQFRNGGFVSQGKIKRGDVVGYTGNTGCGEGCGMHLHLGLWNPNSSSYINPSQGDPYSKKLAYGFQWPYSSSYYNSVSRGFGCSNNWAASTVGCGGSKPYFHAGLDIGASSGTPISAIGDGNIISRSNWGADGGYNVMIEHTSGPGKGLVSRYFHMQPF